jgi:hypothetical protein
VADVLMQGSHILMKVKVVYPDNLIPYTV